MAHPSGRRRKWQRPFMRCIVKPSLQRGGLCVVGGKSRHTRNIKAIGVSFSNHIKLHCDESNLSHLTIASTQRISSSSLAPANATGLIAGNHKTAPAAFRDPPRCSRVISCNSSRFRHDELFSHRGDQTRSPRDVVAIVAGWADGARCLRFACARGS